MTISYQLKVANATFAGFPKLLIRWKGSVYKLMFRELFVFSFLYTTVSLVYRLVLNEPQRRTFERLCIHIDETINHVPLTFVLGFYVSFVVSRWWEQLVSYPWPDRILYLISHYINGRDEKSRMLRRTLARYLNASTVLLTRSLSVVAKKRFPTVDHLVDAGLLTKEELGMYNDVQLQYGKFWVPLIWFTKMLDRAKEEGQLKDPTGMASKQLMDELMAFRTLLGKMFMYDWVSIPVSYTQVVTLATYSYFFGCLFSRQPLDPSQAYKGHTFDTYVPIFTILQFVFYVGWLKVAETLINPWGEDDDDFEVNWFIDRHLQVSYTVVDDMHGKIPNLVRDPYWGTTEVQLPYTEAAMNAKRDEECADLGSTVDYEVPLGKQRLSQPHEPTSRRSSLTAAALWTNTNQNVPHNGHAASGLQRHFQWDIRQKSGVHLTIPDKSDNMDVIVESPPPSVSRESLYSSVISPIDFNSSSTSRFNPSSMQTIAQLDSQGGLKVILDETLSSELGRSRAAHRERPRSLHLATGSKESSLENLVQPTSPLTSPIEDEESGNAPLIPRKHV